MPLAGLVNNRVSCFRSWYSLRRTYNKLFFFHLEIAMEYMITYIYIVLLTWIVYSMVSQWLSICCMKVHNFSYLPLPLYINPIRMLNPGSTPWGDRPSQVGIKLFICIDLYNIHILYSSSTWHLNWASHLYY